jgi:hypothetical protein
MEYCNEGVCRPRCQQQRVMVEIQTWQCSQALTGMPVEHTNAKTHAFTQQLFRSWYSVWRYAYASMQSCMICACITHTIMIYACMYVRMCACVHVCMCVCLYECKVFTYVRMYACISMNVCTCMHVYQSLPEMPYHTWLAKPPSW